MHTEYVTGENDNNSVKAENMNATLSPCYETSDETDSDMDSIKCMHCSQSYSHYGTHTCHVTCTIEHNNLQQSSSNETLVAANLTPTKSFQISQPSSPSSNAQQYLNVSCVLCDENYDNYDDYVIHLNKCITNVKLHHFVCPVCHDMFSDKLTYLEHLKVVHFKVEDSFSDPGQDCVDFAPMIIKESKPKAVRRIGWSIDDIYQEIECTKVEQKPTPTASPIKNFFSKLGNE